MTFFYATELSHGQRSLWFLHHLAPEAGAYNIAAAARVRTPVDVERLERALQALVDRHGALRTTFPAVAGEPCRRVSDHLTFTLAREDATGWSEERLRSRLAEEAWRPFDLEKGPLLRVTLFTGDPRGPVLLLVIHHIVADFWSLAILMREVPALYGEAGLPPPGLSYDEHVRLEREALGDGRGEALLEWWRERLAGLPNLELATDRPRPAVQTYRGDTHRLRLPGELAAALRAQSRARHGTLFMTLTAAFQALLGRHTGQEDVAIGTARSGRSGGAHAQLAGTVGYFVNQVVLRGDLTGDPAFAELLERTKAMVRDAFAHGDYPLPLLAERLQPERDASRTPLFQVSFVLQKETRGAEGLTAFALGEEGVEVGPEDFRLESLAVPGQPAPFDLVLHAVERQGGLSLALQYNTDLFDATTTARLLEHFEHLLAGVAADPLQLLSELPLLSDAERAQLLVEWNDTAAPFPETTLHAAFARQAELHPDLPAAVYAGTVLTYGELARRAGRLARRLRALGVGPEVPVALYLERSAEVVVAILGALEAGGAYLPLDPNHPAERLATMLEDAGRPLLVTERRMAGPLTAAAREVLWLEEDPDDAPPVETAVAAIPENLAYILHTSGSTGKPKGVGCNHRGVLSLMSDFARRQPLAPGSRGSLWTNLGFDVSVYEIFGPLLAGGAVHVVPEAVRQETERYFDWLEAERIENGYVPPFMVAALRDRLERTGEPSSLRRLLVGVEPLPEPLLVRITQLVPGLVIINGYGPTEATISSTLYDVDPWCDRFGEPPIAPIGRPVASFAIYLLGRHQELVPLGVPGEVYVAGVGLARGYLRRPEATAERFVPHPWSTAGGERLYRTGDLARYRPDGQVEFVGRIDHQIKLRGFRIEPGEIEAALLAHPGVREAVVTVWPPADRTALEGRENRRLVAYVVLHPTDPTDPTDRSDLKALLASWLRGRLPSYMVPAVFVVLEAFPLTPSGKLDRKALPDPGAGTEAAAWMPPRTPAEALVAGIFAEVLGIDRVGAEDGFFERGGHSLAALRVMARVREAFGVELPLHRVFETPTVAGLAAAIETAARSGAPGLPPPPPILAIRRGPGEPLPLSFPQQRLWFLHRLEPASAAYNVPAAVHLQGRLDPAVLAASLRKVARRHETLRTRFLAAHGQPVQIVDPPAPVPVPEINLLGLPGECRAAEARRLARAEALRSFDLLRGPVWRATLVRLEDEEHLLLLTLHHIVSDGWSLRVLARELGEVYDAFAQERSPSLPVLDVQYGDYAVWQRRWLQGEVLEAELAYWRTALAEAPPVLDLPLDRPRTAAAGEAGASRAVALPPGLLPDLRELARRQGVTLFMAVLAAFQALLSRVGGSEDVSVGTPVAGRGQMRTEGLIGFFVNTLVMRTDLSGEPSFTRLLARAREVALAAYAHQDLPFDKLVEELQPRRDLGASPLFQVAFALDSEPPLTLRLGGVAASLWPLEAGAEKFDLSLTLDVEAETLRGAFSFRTALFDGATVERLAGHFARLLAAAVADPGRPLPELPLLADGERQQLLIEWNDSRHELAEAALHELVARQAARHPGRPAVVCGTEVLTYADFMERAHRLAYVLRARIGPEEPVALSFDRTPGVLVAILGVLEGGGAYMPLDRSHPRERLAALWENAGRPLVLTERRLVPELPAAAEVLCLDELAETGPAPFLPHPVGPAGLAYVLHTSGSTGQPKAVGCTHRGVLNLLADFDRRQPLTAESRGSLWTSLSFDVSVYEIFSPLLAGGAVHIVPEEVRQSGERFLDWLAEERIDSAYVPPFLVAGLRERLEAAPEAIPLRRLLVGVEPIPEPELVRIAASRPGLAVINGYGPTEATICATLYDVDPRRVRFGTPPIAPIGRPAANNAIHLLDRRLEPVPVGVPGELYIGGAGLARGYLRRPAATAERFVPDPWSTAGERLYRTGDLARRRPDGNLEFAGRIDHQIKLRGFRIEPGEIETALREHPAIREAVAAVVGERGEHRDERRLVAYVVLHRTDRSDLKAVLAPWLRERLPSYLVPAAFVTIPELPLTPSGKLDRKALPAWEPESAPREPEAPRTPAEELLAGIFADVLGVERVGRDDDFFALGGHSLLATQVASRVRTVLGVELPVRTVFEAPTAAALTGWIERSAPGGEKPQEPALARVARDEPLVLSFAQQRLWFLDLLEPGSPLYNIAAAVELTGRLDVAALAAALGEVVRRHEALRMTFRDVEGEPVQVLAEPTVALPVIDLQRVAGAAESRRLAHAEARRPFDLQQGPLLRLTLLKIEPERHRLLLTVHHIVSDGWSMGVLVRELGALYASFRAGHPSPLPELAIQYVDYAAWQRRRLSGDILQTELAWWRDQLAGMPQALELPADHPHPARRGVRGAEHSFAIPSDGLARLSRRHGATLFMTLLAVFAALLRRLTGQDDLGVGTPIAGRTRVETEPLIGLFVNTLVLRVDLSGNPDFVDLLGRVRETTLSAYAHQELPFERLVEELAPERDLSRSPLVQVLFALQNAPMGPLELPDLALAASPVPTGTARLELSCTLTETERGLAGTLEYSRDLFEAPTIARLARSFKRLLAGAVADPRRRLSELPLLSRAERQQVLVEWNDTTSAYPCDASLPELFATVAAERPDAPAIVDGDAVWSYRKLDEASSRLARHLQGLGVEPGTPVGLSLERSAELIVGMLAILKAGGAYVPLDPAYPGERLAFMLADVGARVVVDGKDFKDSKDSKDTGASSFGSLESFRSFPLPSDALAYVIYTSGSTGRPKGVAVPHRGVVRLVRGTNYLRITPEDRVAFLASISFDAATFETWGALLNGAALVVVPETAVLSPVNLGALLRRQRVTVLHLTTALFNQVAREAPETFAPLRAVLFGGEAADASVVARLLEQGAVERLLHFYGPTESTTFSTWARLSRSTGLTIGRPVANTMARILDRQGAPAPPLVAGELHVGGDGLAWGYWHRPELTAERFVPSPWGRGERLYRTGDLVRHRPDGRIEFLGRLDYQVKVRGFRVEPAEIEAVLRQHPQAREAAVVVRENRLVAYVVVDPTDRTDPTDPSDLPHKTALRAWLQERLPAYMVPSFFTVLPALPLTPTGKVDRKALAQLRLERTSAASVAPRTPTEELLAGIFAGVLKLEQVGVTDSFFELGGHSLLAAQVVARIRTVLGVELPVRTVFEAPTVEGLAAAVAGGSWHRPAPPVRVERPGPLPLSFAQERLWFLQQLEPGSATYNMPVAVELSGALDRGAFAAALVEIVRRQESLRTTFPIIDGAPRQWIAPASGFPLPLVDLSALPAPVAEAGRLEREHAATGFDLERGPLVRALLVRLASERHRFLLSLHHIISDGWSLGVLVRELGALYGASRPLPELPVQVADFAVWQRERLAETQAAQLAYWESRLGGEIAPAELPTDRPRPAVQTFRGGRLQLVLSSELTARLHGFGRGEGATLFMTLLAATQTLISRHSGEVDVPVGAPIAGRPWEEIEGVIGCFLNTLVLRTDLSGSPGFRELVARVRTVTLEAYAHQDVPFEAVLARLRLDRDLSRSPLFQVLFNLLSLPASDLALPGLDLRVLTPAEVPSKLDVTFYVSEAEAGVQIDLVYNAGLFDEARMADLLAQLELLLAQAVERPDEPVDHFSLVTGRSRALLPDPTAPLDAGWIGGVHELFAAQAERSPERPAVVDNGVVWSYGDLLAGSRGVAGWLAVRGVRPGDPVAIFAQRSAPLVQAIQGVLRAGAAFVILDPAYPAPRLAEMLRLASPRAWIGLEAAGSPPEAVEAWLKEAGCPWLELPAGGRASLEIVAAFSGDAPRVAAGPHDLACIGFTSGSTGGPKGILGLHGSLSHFLPAYCAELGLGPDDRFSLLSGLSHDPLQRDIFTALYLGAAIVVPDPADFGIAGRLADWMNRERVTVSHLTPALSQLLTAHPPGGAPAVVPSLGRAILIGEALTRQDVARLHALAPGVTCFNLYGATETQRALSFHRVTRDEARSRQVLPLGRGFRDAQLLVMNFLVDSRAGALAGVGEAGEIVVRSPHLARGYLGDPEATAARFQVNPFTGAAGDRIYRTGDLGRYLPDGEVAFAGRADLQVKLRGFRIELAEIEAALARHPAVREAVVLLRDDLPGGPGLVAFVVPGAAGAADPARLHDHLWQQLPAYMVPAAFLFLESLPRTPSGKIDRRSLSRLDLALPSSDEETRPPRTPVEEIVAGLWAEVLGRDRIGPDDNFFQLGGHSLTGAQIVSRLREVFQVELPLRVLFEAPTLAGLAAEVERRRRPEGAPERPAIAAFRQDRSAPPPLSFAQERLWAERETEARSIAFTIPTLVVLAGDLDLPCLWRALQEVVDRHEVLRTTFRDEAGHSIQVVQPPRPFPFPVVDLEGLSRSAQKEEIGHWSTFEGRRHFDLENGPLFRLALFRCAARESALLFVVHHIAFDGWSRSVLTRELAALYNAFRAGRPSPLRPLPTQYQDFARWQREALQGEALEREVGFWREHLRGASPVRLGRQRPARPTFEAGIEVLLIPEELERKLATFAAAHCVTLFMTLLAAFETVLHEESGRDDIAVTCLFANRNQLEIEGLIGNFFAGLPLRTRLSGARTFRDLLERVRDATLAAIEHPDILYDPVMEGLGILAPGERGGLATFRILFQLAQLPRSEQTLSGLELIHQPFDTGKIRQDLSLFLTQGDRLGGRFKYNRDVLDAETVVRLRDRFLQILSEIVDDPERPLEIRELAERAGRL